MKIIITSMPATGHINPMVALGRMLVDEGHDVIGMSANAMRKRIEAAGLRFHPLPKGADFDLTDIDAAFPERKNVPVGPKRIVYDLETVFIEPLAAQYEGLKGLLRTFPADIIIGDNFFLGVLPMLLGPRSARPPIILCGTSFLHHRRADGAPHFAGLPPAANERQRQEYVALAKEHNDTVYTPAGRILNKALAQFGVGPVTSPILEAVMEVPDRYLQLSIPSFEFPLRDIPPAVRFVGPLPIIPNQAPIPTWAGDVDGSRKVVLVTQGTVSNHDFGQLVTPTLEALANEKDILVVATTGGRNVDAIPGPIPSNARVASYLPFEWILPKTDAFVTNGGFGSVNQALSFGVPLVAAGMAEDKADVNARVAWSGAGINLKTNDATPAALREAVRSVLDTPDYRTRAMDLAKDYRSIDTRAEVLKVIEDVLRDSAEELMQPKAKRA
jgi:UDP:flavonoid glycosyltransferase YjiC (YdhE family)